MIRLQALSPMNDAGSHVLKSIIALAPPWPGRIVVPAPLLRY